MIHYHNLGSSRLGLTWLFRASYNTLNMSGKDVEDFIKVIVILISIAIPIVFWYWFGELFNKYEWTKFVIPSFTLIIIFVLVIIWINLIKNKTRVHWGIWTLLGYYSFMTIMGIVSQAAFLVSLLS